MLLFAITTAFLSAFLDNVTTVLLIAPVTVSITLSLRLNPVPFLISEVLASNIGGTATLIGDPPNIMIGSYAGLTFNDFILNLTPVVALSMLVLVAMVRAMYGKEYARASSAEVEEQIREMRRKYKIRDKPLLAKCLAILGGVILLFVLHGSLRGYMGEIMEVSIPDLLGGVVAVLVSRQSIVKVLEDVEWPTLLFFVGLFIVVGGTVETGVIDAIAGAVRDFSGNNLAIARKSLTWTTAVPTVLPPWSAIVIATP
jgi:Na+/H+ antiporter NhaD/arsenite permease-like protein